MSGCGSWELRTPAVDLADVDPVPVATIAARDATAVNTTIIIKAVDDDLENRALVADQGRRPGGVQIDFEGS
ncbi:MAG: hypothetical protein OEN01_02285 [Candidatus Krumholzibacteria bacterium]|nr:hypothetical protein [Candidatus Krumholzibacteria bacterium]